MSSTREPASKFASGDLNDPQDRVNFNTCLPNPSGTNPDKGYKAYRLAVHEAVHALGLADITLDLIEIIGAGFKQPYETAHPTIPDSAMNYDGDVPKHWARWAPSPLNEPDCSPHPFDILAIYALYQTVK